MWTGRGALADRLRRCDALTSLSVEQRFYLPTIQLLAFNSRMSVQAATLKNVFVGGRLAPLVGPENVFVGSDAV
ncbi:MAG TPA: hypothetical protein VGT79_01460 [Xanthomonadaceae bacterium]|nr:hypothetical protein [Xanthomonadaceae bacterium]